MAIRIENQRTMMARIISPSRSEFPRLRTPLEPSEKRVFDLFDQKLDIGWEIYVQPHLNGCRPDFILLNPNVGIGVIEVKDWDLDAMEYARKTDARGIDQIVVTNRGKTFVRDNPVMQVRRYKQAVFDIYCPRLAARSGLAAIAAGVIFPFARDTQLRRLFNRDLLTEYEFVAGADAIACGDITRVFPAARHRSSRLMSPELADDLRSWLIEPDYAAEQRQPLELDATQHKLVTRRTPSGYRRIRGPAGSGKSVVLAARAAQLANEGKDVLVITYNITLIHYLRDLCARIPGGRPNRITWMNFHDWCKRVALELDLHRDYGEVWHDHFEHGRNAFSDVPAMLLQRIPQLGEIPRAATYDAILVDEGQDFDPLWWRLLRCICREGGEMVLVADATQDVYGSARRWTHEAMTGAGLRGPWNELPASYRLPPLLLQIAANFAETFLPADLRESPKPPPVQTEVDFSPCELRWVQVEHKAATRTCFDELMRLITTDLTNSRSMTDLTLLTDNVADGIAIVGMLRMKDIKTTETFSCGNSGRGSDRREDRRKKLAFWKGNAQVKVATLHSFKGWEARLLVLNISRAKSLKDYTVIYTGLTRLKKHFAGSVLTVVCAEPRLKDFGACWPIFVDQKEDTSHMMQD